MKTIYLMLVLIAILVISGCSQNGGGPEIVINPTDISLDDLILTNSDLDNFQFKDLSKSPDFQEEMENPWLIKGTDAKKWVLLTDIGQFIDKEKIVGILFVILTDKKTDFGYYAIEYDNLEQSDIDGIIESMNYLVRQKKERFELYITQNIAIILWGDNNIKGLNYLSELMETKYALTETSIDYVSSSDDLIQHINTELTLDFNEINDVYAKKCTNDNDCDQIGVKQICLKCPEGKFVYFYKSCEYKPGISESYSDQGLCVQEHSLGSSYNAFYEGGCIGTKFCLMNFQNQEVPTVYPEETLKFLPLWKEKLFEQGLDDQYFNSHIYIYSSDLSKQNNPYFIIKYYFKIDWVTILDSDSTIIKDDNSVFNNNTIKDNFKIKLTHPIKNILTKENVKEKLKECSNGMTFDESKDVRLSDINGKLILEAWEKSLVSNKCKKTELDLETGEILSCQDTACILY